MENKDPKEDGEDLADIEDYDSVAAAAAPNPIPPSTSNLNLKENAEIPLEDAQQPDQVANGKRKSAPNKIVPRARRSKKSKQSLKELKQSIQMDEHLFTLERLATEKYPESGINVQNPKQSSGLSTAEASRRLSLFGPNRLEPKRRRPIILVFLLMFTQFFSLLLLVGAILCFIGFIVDLVQSVIIPLIISDSESSNFFELLFGPQFPKDNLLLGILLLFVVFVSNVFSFRQKYKSEKVMQGFLKLIPVKAKVFRENGKLMEINAAELVKGDIIFIKGGDKIPADVRIIYEKDFKVDNSSITGESEPQTREVENLENVQNPLEAKNLAFFGTLATFGECYGLVVFTGENTMIGRISVLSAKVQQEKTHLQKEIDRFVRNISILAIVIGIIFFAIGLIQDILTFGLFGFNVISHFVFMIGIIVAVVPEGLMVTMTVSLALAAQRMASKSVLVKYLEAVETLGSVTTIASDKTGTLTQNRMTVSHLYYDDVIFNAAANPSEESNFVKDSKTFMALLRVIGLCNKAIFEENPDKRIARKVSMAHKPTIGDASESALLKFSEKQLLEIFEMTTENYRKNHKEIFGIPFNSVNKWQLSVHEIPNSISSISGNQLFLGNFNPISPISVHDEEATEKHKIIDYQKNQNNPILLMKGAPERIIDLCKYIMIEGKKLPMTKDWREKFEDANQTLGTYGERVMGFAQKEIINFDFQRDPKEFFDGMELPPNDLVFIGLVSMIDPPRPGVFEAVKKCRTAGIKIIMVTGDHQVTAQAIARKVGIITGKTKDDIAGSLAVPVSKVSWDQVESAVVQGSDIPSLTETDWMKILSKREIVFARTTPQQKLIIVEHCQKRGEVVAVTGDGVNDSPALKKANIGIAMGGGSDVSKEAADLILMDDNFASIVNGIAEGRRVFDNLKKTVAFALSAKFPELLPFLCIVIFGIPLPLSTILILLVDMGSDLLPGISLAYETEESDIMHRPPRDMKKDSLVTPQLIAFSTFQIGVIQAVSGFFSYFFVFAYYGFPIYVLPGLGRTFFLRKNSPPIVNSNGEIFDHARQREILQEAQSAYLISIFVVQWADLLICKTRKLSLTQQGMTHNKFLNFALLFSMALALVVIYTPFIGYFLTTRPVHWFCWLAPIPFALLILGYDEMRKMMIRFSKPDGWFVRTLYW